MKLLKKLFIYLGAAFLMIGSFSAETLPEETTENSSENPKFISCEPYSVWTVYESNIYEEPTEQSEQVGTIEKYEEVKVIGTYDSLFFKITYGDISGYIYSSFTVPEDPHTQKVYIYNEETGAMRCYDFQDMNPDEIDAIIQAERIGQKEVTVEDEETKNDMFEIHRVTETELESEENVSMEENTNNEVNTASEKKNIIIIAVSCFAAVVIMCRIIYITRGIKRKRGYK